MSLILLVFGLLAFIGLVVIHEFGHFLASRKSDVDVEEFGVGFPPRAVTLTKKKGTEYTLNWLPLGGFVRLKGEHDDATEKGSYGAASLKNKVFIMTAGVAMNLATALILFTIVALMGMPKLVDNQFTVASDTKIVEDVDNKNVVLVGEVVDKSPASKAGIEKDQELVSIDGIILDKPEQLSEITSTRASKEVVVVTKDNSGNIESKKITLADTKPYLGIAPYSGETGYQIRRSTWSAPIVAVGVTKDFTILTMKGIGSAFKGLGSMLAGFTTGNQEARQKGQTAATEQVSGPVGIFVVLRDGSSLGLAFILMVIAVISLTLAIMNILPIPALDGGRLFVTLFYRLRGKKLTAQAEDRIHGTGMAVLLTLFLLITIVDVRRFF